MMGGDAIIEIGKRKLLPKRVIVEYPRRRDNPRCGEAGQAPLFLQRRRSAGRAGGVGGDGRRDPDSRLREPVPGLALAGASGGADVSGCILPNRAARSFAISSGAER